ncbi:MAG: phosphonatase-like hydrolase [Polyangiales bacterium]|nr:phosphonatase-like hydrolase [Myxococcales bacterium]
MIDLVVFDMAGTVIKDDDVVLDAFVRAATETGLTTTREEINARMGMGKLEVFDELAGRQSREGAERARLRDAGYAAFRRTLEDAYRQGGVAAMPGAHTAVQGLRRQGIRVALNTGFYRAVTDILVDRAGFAGAVDAVVCVDDVPVGRPYPFMIFEAMARTQTPSVARVAVVGDTPVDIEAGRNAGARLVVGVTSGAHTARTLRHHGATHVVDGVHNVPELVRRTSRHPHG